ncbi:MAG: portal protein, partial [Albidovulum sp.]
EVMADETDQPLLAQDGDYITRADRFRPQTFFDPATGQEQPLSGGDLVLDRDNTTPAPIVENWVQIVAKRRNVLFEGPESLPLYFKDFLAPLIATDLQAADCIVHLYDKPVAELVNQLMKRGAFDAGSADDPARLREAQKAIDLVRTLAQNSSASKSGVTLSARPNEEEFGAGYGASSDRMADSGEPVAEIAEVYLWYDANGDGVQENIMLLLDRASERPIYYDHVANLTPDGLRPFDVVRINEVDNRWYGLGVMETFDSSQQIVDLLVNRWNHSQSRAGRVDVWRPDLTLEGDSDPNLKLNWGKAYTGKPDADPSKILTSFYLNDTKFANLQAMFEFFMQMAMNESGVQHANDGAAIGMDSQKLATGIRNIEKAGQEMFAPILSDLEPGLTATLNREMLTLLANLNEAESFRYLEGDQKIRTVITPEEVNGLRLDVSLLLTRYKGEQQFQQMLQASNVVKDYYALAPQVQAYTAPFYQGMIKALDSKLPAEQIIQPVPMPITETPRGTVGTTGSSGAQPTPATLPSPSAEPAAS